MFTGSVMLTAEDGIRLFLGHTARMHTSVSLYHRHRFPTQIISHYVWLYFRFTLSFRDVEEMLAMRGISLSYETVENGALSSVRLMPTGCGTSPLDLATDGTWMKCFSKSTGESITYGERSIRMATC